MSGGKLNPVFAEKTIALAGTEFRLRELTAEQYDECVKMATGPNDDIDMTALLRLMLVRSLIEPAMSADEIVKLPYRMVRRLNAAVNELHFSDLEEGNE